MNSFAFWKPADELARLAAMRNLLESRGVDIYPNDPVVLDGAGRKWTYDIRVDNEHGDHIVLTAPGTNDAFASMFHTTTLLRPAHVDHRFVYCDSVGNISVYFEPYQYVVVCTSDGLDDVLRVLRAFGG